MTRLRYVRRRKAWNFVVDLEPRTPTHYRGDPTRLGQILLNLLSNAAKFTERGEIGVSLRVGAGGGEAGVAAEAVGGV